MWWKKNGARRHCPSKELVTIPGMPYILLFSLDFEKDILFYSNLLPVNVFPVLGCLPSSTLLSLYAFTLIRLDSEHTSLFVRLGPGTVGCAFFFFFLSRYPSLVIWLRACTKKKHSTKKSEQKRNIQRKS